MLCPHCLVPVSEASLSCAHCGAAVLAPPTAAGPAHVLAHVRTLLAQGETTEALARLQRLLADGVATPDVHHLQGDILVALAAYRPAVEAYRTVLALAPDTPGIHARIDAAIDALSAPPTPTSPTGPAPEVRLTPQNPERPIAATSRPQLSPRLAALLISVCLLISLLSWLGNAPGVQRTLKAWLQPPPPVEEEGRVTEQCRYFLKISHGTAVPSGRE
jgi:hypothetical protein